MGGRPRGEGADPAADAAPAQTHKNTIIRSHTHTYTSGRVIWITWATVFFFWSSISSHHLVQNGMRFTTHEEADLQQIQWRAHCWKIVPSTLARSKSTSASSADSTIIRCARNPLPVAPSDSMLVFFYLFAMLTLMARPPLLINAHHFQNPPLFLRFSLQCSLWW